MSKEKCRVASSLEDYLAEEGILEETTATALRARAGLA